MCCKAILSFCILSSLGNALYFGSHRPQYLREVGQRQYPFEPQAFGMLPVPQQPMGPQPMGPQPMEPQPLPMGPQSPQMQVPDRSCSGCVININCGGRECLPTRPTQTQPTQPSWTVETPPTPTPGASQGCRVCACYVPPPCQICQPCQ
uniref:Major microfilarial sheath protein n=2 Tax=Litomosoides TaxID=6298 RepID=GP22_LITCA|nr:RecName: Full=Major microfilarial sheath protein; Flags: Precursor [Litomosoides carinii]AAA29278.1 major microfilarial sheath protein [Litomosoides sigmodontis]